MTTQAVLILEWMRPRYLQLCLASLRRVAGIGSWPILVSLDGPEHVGKFPPPKGFEYLHCWQNHAGNLWHTTRSIEMAFRRDFDRVLFIDGDTILRPDALSDLPEQQSGDVFLSMVSGSCRRHWLTPTGNIIRREHAVPLLEWVKSKRWLGHKRPGFDTVLASSYPGFDAIYCDYLIEHRLFSLYRDRSYAGHVGVCGVDNHSPELEDQMFSGPPESWLDNAIRLFDPKIDKGFTPVDFRYYDA